ncbi:GH23154 [Drosophila grimshawi]|uniref:GPI alpha-1,4-mannosyltransferase I, catalytic subunit n=2 Tax=Drosophila grimshawi TaxID=7222 RepID=B4JVN4_DROGR|nr:GH23154 [Drosophila grimshawi]
MALKKNTWLQNGCRYLSHLSFRNHLLISAVLRLVLILYAQLHDARSLVPFTDIDYKVVTDGARLALNGDTPFARHTYRYSPFLAYMQIPNVLLHPAYGKVIYAMFDLLLGILIYGQVRLDLLLQHQKDRDECKRTEKTALISACFWLYNPLTAVISTRGNGDSIPSFFVLLSISLLIRMEQQLPKSLIIFCAGLSHGFVVHLRIYPIVFSLAYYLCLSTGPFPKPFKLNTILPNKQQLWLVFGTLLGLVTFTWIFYALYGWQYIYEAYFYHLMRKDMRHNFSLYFLLQYLSNAEDIEESSLLLKCIVVVPQLLLLFYLSWTFGQHRQTLAFCVFCLAFVVVTYNSVVTSQYFIWYLTVLPLCIKNLQHLSLVRCASLLSLWLCGQVLWLLPAYLLEFKTWHTFFWIGVQGAVFFLINGYILVELISNYEHKSFNARSKK